MSSKPYVRKVGQVPGEAPRSCVLVTGAAGGIGRAATARFHNEGYDVLAIDKLPQPVDWELGTYLQFDLEELVQSPQECKARLDAIKSWCGDRGLEVLVNNAAVQVCGPTEDLSITAWEESLRVNLLAPFFLVQHLLPLLEQVRGCVVNVSSIHARLTKPGFVVYATTKAALSGMTRAMAVDLGPRIRVNAVEPAAVETDMLRASFEGREDDFVELAQCHPVERLAAPDEVAALVSAIATGEFRFLHGACLDLSGGVSARLHDPV